MMKFQVRKYNHHIQVCLSWTWSHGIYVPLFGLKCLVTYVDMSVRQASATNSKSKGLFLLGQRFCFFCLDLLYTPLYSPFSIFRSRWKLWWGFKGWSKLTTTSKHFGKPSGSPCFGTEGSSALFICFCFVFTKCYSWYKTSKISFLWKLLRSPSCHLFCSTSEII